jgi:F-type H+-transporting ATPase subunit a
MNMMGLIPYSFTVTSQIIVTLSLSLTLFLGINIICVKKHNLEFFSLFLPAGTSIYLALLLVPVEFISYLFRPLSLAIRLFCNITASHVLLKITAGFAWSLMNVSGFSFLLHYIPLFIILPLIGLELFMSITQAYVFSLMLCIYLNDALNLH